MNPNQLITMHLEQFVADCKRVGYCLESDFDLSDPAVKQVADAHFEFIKHSEDSHTHSNPLRSKMWNVCGRTIVMLNNWHRN